MPPPFNSAVRESLTLVQLANPLEELGARAAQLASIALQAAQYSHVALIDDTFAMSLHVSAARLIALLPDILSDCDRRH
jgi:hypothetical protein